MNKLPPRKLFISYRHGPSLGHAKDLYSALTGPENNLFLPENVFFDKERVKAGDFENTISKAIAGCTDFLLLLEGDCLKKYAKKPDYFYKEILLALQLRKNIIPIQFASLNRKIASREVKAVFRLNGPIDVGDDCFQGLTPALFHVFCPGYFPDEYALQRKWNKQDKAMVKSRQNIESKESLFQRWSNAQEVHLCFYTGYKLFSGDNAGTIKSLLQKGLKMEIIVNDPKCRALKDALRYKGEDDQPVVVMKKTAQIYSSTFLEFARTFPNNFSFKYTSMYLTYAYQEVVGKTEQDNQIKIDLYGVQEAPLQRRSFIVPYDDTENYSYLKSRFEVLWNNQQLCYPDPRVYAPPINPQIKSIQAESIETALKEKGISEYLVGNLRRPQALANIPDSHIGLAIAKTDDEPYEDEAHYHTLATEYHYVLEGSVDLFDLATGTIKTYQKGDFFIIYPNTPYKTVIAPHSRVLFVKSPLADDKATIFKNDK
jgi:hypothetical protein